MSTEAGSVVVSRRSALFTLWTVAVSALAAAALILSALALNVAARSERSATSVESIGTQGAAAIGSPLWDEGKLQAMEVRMDLAEAALAPGTSTLWDSGKLQAMEVRMDLAEAARADGTVAP